MILTLVFKALVAVAIAGLLVRWLCFRLDSSGAYRVTWREYTYELIVMTVLIAPLTAFVGVNAATTNLVTFNEYWNGWEFKAVRRDIACTRDGSCAHEYDCDPYTVRVSYSCGKDLKDTCYRDETEYHSCPYVDVESNFYVETTLGTFTIDTHRFPENPNQSRWRRSKRIPSYVIERAGTGVPEFWSQVQARIEAGIPGPVQKRMSYKNYILASDQTILQQYSSSIQRYLDAGLMPEVVSNVYNFYMADKVHFVGYQPDDPNAWQRSLSYLVAGLGMELQGDVQLVIVNQKEINQNPDEYVIALKAYWQDASVFGRDTLSKNGIGVVVGTEDNKTIAWARAFTGMPLGNEKLLNSMRNELRGLPLTPEAVIGDIRGEFRDGKPAVRSVRSGGMLPALLWGEIDSATTFARISMSGDDADDNGSGFLYLMSEIKPTPTQNTVIIVCIFILGMVLWGVCALYDLDEVFARLLNRKSGRKWS